MIRILLIVLLLPAIAIAQSPAEERALREVDEFTTLQARSDPHFKRAEAELLPRIDALVAANPAGEWLPVIRRQYLAISERLHREERERIARDEQRAAAAAGGLQQRFTQLTAELESGKIGPREHALRAVESAGIYFPNDQALIAWRRAKVPIATDYELGRITRTEYDERWARASASYEQAVGAREQGLRRACEDELRSIQDAARARQPTTCTSQMVLGRLQTTCR
jgi:hypothetical protein